MPTGSDRHRLSASSGAACVRAGWIVIGMNCLTILWMMVHGNAVTRVDGRPGTSALVFVSVGLLLLSDLLGVAALLSGRLVNGLALIFTGTAILFIFPAISIVLGSLI